MAMVLGLVGCAVVLLCLVFPAGGVGTWYFVFRDNKPADQTKNDPNPAAKEINVTLANPRIDRFGDDIQVSVDFEVADPKADDSVALALVCPSAAGNLQVVKVIGNVELKGTPKGRWSSARFRPDQAVRNDAICDIVVRLPDGGGDYKNGKELAKLAGVSIPPRKGGAPEFNLVLSNAKVEAEPSPIKLHKISVDLKLTGTPKPVHYHGAVVFSVKGEKQMPLKFGGAALARSLTDGMKLSGYVEVPADSDATCAIIVHEVLNEKIGPVAEVRNVPIPKGGGGQPSVISLTNAKVERSSVFPDLCTISVDAKSAGADKDELYNGAVVFSVGGVKQKPVMFGIRSYGNDLAKGIKIEDRSVKMPATADDVCEIILQRGVGVKAVTAASLKDVAVEGSGGAADSKYLVVFSNVRVYRLDDFAVLVKFEYEFSKPPDPNKWYTMQVQRGDLKDKVNFSTGRICLQLKGDKMPMKGEVDQRVPGPDGWGSAKTYRVWTASGINPLDAAFRESKTHLVKVSSGDPTGRAAALSKVKVDRIDDTRVRVQLDYEFAKDPDPKRTYAILVQRADVDESKAEFNPTVRKEQGDKWQKKGQVKADVQADGKGQAFKVWLVETPNVLVSNKVTVIAGDAGGATGNEPIQITQARLTSLGPKMGSRIELSYKFVGDARPDAKANYVVLIQMKGAKPAQIANEAGAKFKAENSYNLVRPILVPGDAEVEVWFIDGVQNRIVSNKLRVEIKGK